MCRYLGRLEPERAEQLQVEREAGQPLLAAYDVRRAHERVVHRVGEMVSGHPVALEQHVVHVVFRQFQRAFDKVCEFELARWIAFRAKADDKGRAPL